MIYTESSVSRTQMESDILAKKLIFIGDYDSIHKNMSRLYIKTNNNIYIIKNNNNNNKKYLLNIINKYNNIIIFNLNNINLNNIFNNLESNKIEKKLLINKIWINIKGLYYSATNKALTKDIMLQLNTQFEENNKMLQSFYLYKNNNNIIPTVSILSSLGLTLSNTYKSLFFQYKNYITSEDYKSYIERSILFSKIYNNGIYIDNKRISKIINDIDIMNILKIKNKKLYNTIINFSDNNNNIIYPEYYLDRTPTGRIMSSYKSTNMMALNKSDITRALIRSRFKDGKLFDFDYDGMQLRIISNLINFNIPTELRAHKYMASIIYNINYNDITSDQVKCVKEMIWKILYGRENLKDFSEKLLIFKNNIFQEKTPLGRKIKKDLDSHYQINYFINKYEVDYITISLNKIIKYIDEQNLNLKLIMYTYDGFIIDCPLNEFKYISKIKEIAENTLTTHKYPLKVMWGTNYKNMEKYNE